MPKELEAHQKVLKAVKNTVHAKSKNLIYYNSKNFSLISMTKFL